MAAAKLQRYDIAINSQGFILAPEPGQPALKGRQNEVFSQRIAQGDRDYNDFIAWWYLAQTDWFAGFKDVVMWADDSHYYYSTNIDALSEPGAIKIAQTFGSALLTANDSTAWLTCGCAGLQNSVASLFVGTEVGAGSRAVVSVSTNGGSTWADVSSGTFPTSIASIQQLNIRNNFVWAHNLITGTTYGVTYRNGAAWVDATANINTQTGFTMLRSPCGVSATSGTYYTFVYNFSTNNWALVKTAVSGPTAAGDWTVLLNKSAVPTMPVAAAEYLSKIYYLMSDGELRVYNPADSSDANVTFFTSASVDNTSSQRSHANLLKVFNNKLRITLPPTQVWDYDGTTFTSVYSRDTNKATLDDATALLITSGLAGGIAANNNFYWGNLINLIYSGTSYLHNWMKDDSEVANTVFYPIFADSSGNIFGSTTTNPHKLYEITKGASVYHNTAGKNYLVFNNFDKVSGIDKLAYSLTCIFKTLTTGQSITWEYTTGELTSATVWTTLGTASFGDGGSQTTRTFYFGDAVLFKKIWFRVKPDTTSISTTPVLYDGPVLAYLPMPDYKLHWEFTVKCQNKLQLKDQSVETKDALWLRNFLQNAWMTKSVLSFEDYDSVAVEYVGDNPLTSSATTITVQGNTDNFPELGRLLIESEEILYSGKNKTQFLNCTRGSRGSIAAGHVANVTISMARRVIIRNYYENLVIANNPLNMEYHVSLALQEV